MRTISNAMKAHLAGDALTIATCWRVQRAIDGAMFGFTDHDSPLIVNGETYISFAGYQASALQMSSDLSTNNLEVNALFVETGPVNRVDIEAGLWNFSAVTIFIVNYADLTMGTVVMSSGVLGQFQCMNGRYVAELRGLAQLMQTEMGQQFSPTCRASLGDSRCKFNISGMTYSGTVGGVVGRTGITDTGLTAVGPTVPYYDTQGHNIPGTYPYQITAVSPTGGTWQSGISVVGADGAVWTPAGSTGTNQYTVSGGLYTFDVTNAGQQVHINFNYAIGYYAFGLLTFTSGLNAGYSMDVRTSSVGALTLALPMARAIQVGDTYTVTPGCDRTAGTCNARFNNIVNFRGEPFIPGPDTIFRIQGG